LMIVAKSARAELTTRIHRIAAAEIVSQRYGRFALICQCLRINPTVYSTHPNREEAIARKVPSYRASANFAKPLGLAERASLNKGRGEGVKRK
jgi:hypothetical protein